MTKQTYTILNNDDGTAWNVGAKVERVSEWINGVAGFTVAGLGGCVIHASAREVGVRLKSTGC